MNHSNRDSPAPQPSEPRPCCHAQTAFDHCSTEPLAEPGAPTPEPGAQQVASQLNRTSCRVMSRGLHGTRSLLRVTPVGRPEAGQGLQRSDTLRLLERDVATDDLRRRVGGYAAEGTIRNQDGLDMLTVRLPGTDLILGMSRRLYGACREVAGMERRIAEEVRRTRLESLMPRERPAEPSLLPGAAHAPRYRSLVPASVDASPSSADRSAGHVPRTGRRGP